MSVLRNLFLDVVALLIAYPFAFLGLALLILSMVFVLDRSDKR